VVARLGTIWSALVSGNKQPLLPRSPRTWLGLELKNGCLALPRLLTLAGYRLGCCRLAIFRLGSYADGFGVNKSDVVLQSGIEVHGPLRLMLERTGVPLHIIDDLHQPFDPETLPEAEWRQTRRRKEQRTPDTTPIDCKSVVLRKTLNHDPWSIRWRFTRWRLLQRPTEQAVTDMPLCMVVMVCTLRGQAHGLILHARTGAWW
jgi:hypothetical protein